jgi:hypothetical protein
MKKKTKKTIEPILDNSSAGKFKGCLKKSTLRLLDEISFWNFINNENVVLLLIYGFVLLPIKHKTNLKQFIMLKYILTPLLR